MIAATIRELGGSDVDDPFFCSVRNLVYETEDILVGISEAHTTTDTGFEVGCGTGQVKGNHTLILIPNVYHTVYFVIRRIYI